MKLIGITLSLLLLLAGIIWYLFFSNPPAPNSIVVIPLTYSGDTGSIEIADEFTQDFVSGLSSIPYVDARSLGTTLHYKYTTLEDKEIAKEVNVQYLLKGNVKLSEGMLTVSYTLVNPYNGKLVHSYSLQQRKDQINEIRTEIFRQLLKVFEKH